MTPEETEPKLPANVGWSPVEEWIGRDTIKRQRVISQVKGQDKTPEKRLYEVEMGNFPEKEFRIMIVKMIQDLRKRMEAKIEKMQKIFAEELKNKQR